MNLYTIDTGFFKLDGGAMFGVVPKSIWQRINPPDANNLCTWALRLMLVEKGNRLILIDTGIGDKQSEKFFSYYEPHGDDSTEKSLKKHGFSPEDITDVFLTHFHFDHVGGAVKRDGEKLVPAFPNARYWSNERHFDWATYPNPREKASMLKENFMPLKENGQMEFLGDQQKELLPGFEIHMANGHTEAQMIPHIRYKGKTVVYMADLLPSAGHVPLPYVMAYDVRPLVTLEEKERFLQQAVEEGHILFFEHDKEHECCTLKQTEKGVRPDEFFKLSEI